MKKRFGCTMIGLLAIALTASAAADEKESKADKKRAQIDTVTEETLAKLFDKKADATELYEKAYGYAVFDNWKMSLFLASGRGAGVAVRRDTGDRTYMRMGSVGINVGLGVQKMQVVFLFETQKVFDRFVNKGWKADASANAAIAKKGATADAKFVNGIAVYQFTDKGLMLQADLSGTKYYKKKKLNDD